MRARFSGYGSGTSRIPAITLSQQSIDESAPAGTVVGALAPPGAGWTLHLADSAGGRFSLRNGSIVVGSTALDRATMPRPAILVAATNGSEATAARLEIEIWRALPALPLATGARVAAIGDSLIGYNNYTGGPVTAAERAVSSFGYGPIEQALSIDPRFDFDSWYDPAEPTGRGIAGANQGIFGDHLDWEVERFGGGILGRLPDVLARRPNLLILSGGTNTINTGDTGTNVPVGADYCIVKLDAALRQARAAGVPVVLTSIFPRNDIPAGDARHRTILDVNTWIRAQAGRSGIVGICDPFATLSTNGIVDSSLFMTDTVHLSHRGAFLVARDHLLPILQACIAPGSVFDQDPSNANLMTPAQAKMQGAGGTKTGTPLPTGSVATGFGVQSSRNVASIACSKVVLSGDMEGQVIEIAPIDASAAPYGQVEISIPPTTLPSPAAGKWYRAAIRIEASGSEALSTARLSAHLKTLGNSVSHTAAFTLSVFSPDFTTGTFGNRGWWLCSKPFQAPSGVVCDRMALGVTLYFIKTAPPFTIMLSRPMVREIADPRPRWGY